MVASKLMNQKKLQEDAIRTFLINLQDKYKEVSSEAVTVLAHFQLTGLSEGTV